VNQPSSSSPWPLRGLLLLALALFSCGIWWGLPGRWGWAGDELHPTSWPEAISTAAPANKRIWHLRYPPLHFAVLQGTSFPLRWLIDRGTLGLDDDAATSWLIFFGRFVSLAMAMGTVWLIWCIGCEIYDRRSALFAALSAICAVPMVYYSKMGNLDAPYVFWFTLSLLFYVRILKRHRVRDYVLFALAAAAAVCTKDQAYGLYSLAPLPILVSLYLHAYREKGPVRGILRALFDRRLLLAAGTAALGFAVFEEVIVNPQRFLVHVQLLVGPMSKDYEDYSDTPLGHFELMSQVFKQVIFVLDPLLAAVCAAGIGVTGWRIARRRAGPEDWLLGALLVLVVSYYVTFLNLILFSYDRYLLPVAVLLAFFAGRVLGMITRPGGTTDGVRWLRLRQAAVAAGFVYALLYAASVDTRLLADSRYYVEDWVAAHAPKPVSVAAIGRKKHIPRFTWMPWEKVLHTQGRIIELKQPQFLTVNVTDLRRPEEVDIYQQLATGELGYRLVLLYKGHPLFDLITTEEVGSSQRFINPEVALFQRLDDDRPAAGVPSDPPPVANSRHGAV
jgi:Dolichyl-phosphate-mannose-protein mannosyltransferase